MQPDLSVLRFEGPFRFHDRSWQPHVGRTPVVYRLRAWNDVAGEPRPIERAAAVDPLGILDIGESSDGRRRLETFLAAASGRGAPHRAGLQYARRGYDFGTVFPLDTLRIEFVHVGSKELAETIELALLEEYRWRYKDRPPLNGSEGKYAKVEAWLRGCGRGPRTPDGWLNISDLLPTG